MPLFTSTRERRLWLWTLAVVVAIYSTLGLAASVAAKVDDRLAAAAFLLAMALIGVTVLTQGLRVKPGGLEIGFGLGIAAVYGMVLLRMTIPERSHLIEYSVVAIFIYEALAERVRRGRRVPWPPALAVLAASLAGAVDEGIQLYLPSRVFDWVDILFNTLAAVMAVSAMATLDWVRRRFGRPGRE